MHELTGNCWIRLEFLPKTDDDDERRYEADYCETKPHESFAKWTIRFSNVTNTMQR